MFASVFKRFPEALPAASVTVSDVDVEVSFIFEYAANFLENFDEPSDIFLDRIFKSNLPLHAIIAELIIGRRCNAQIHAAAFNAFQLFERVSA